MSPRKVGLIVLLVACDRVESRSEPSSTVAGAAEVSSSPAASAQPFNSSSASPPPQKRVPGCDELRARIPAGTKPRPIKKEDVPEHWRTLDRSNPTLIRIRMESTGDPLQIHVFSVDPSLGVNSGMPQGFVRPLFLPETINLYDFQIVFDMAGWIFEGYFSGREVGPIELVTAQYGNPRVWFSADAVFMNEDPSPAFCVTASCIIPSPNPARHRLPKDRPIFERYYRRGLAELLKAGGRICTPSEQNF